jgi:hypothetical protein
MMIYVLVDECLSQLSTPRCKTQKEKKKIDVTRLERKGHHSLKIVKPGINFVSWLLKRQADTQKKKKRRECVDEAT